MLFNPFKGLFRRHMPSHRMALPPQDTRCHQLKTKIAQRLGKYESALTTCEKKIVLVAFLLIGCFFFSTVFYYGLLPTKKRPDSPAGTTVITIPPIATDTSAIGDVWNQLQTISGSQSKHQNNDTTKQKN